MPTLRGLIFRGRLVREALTLPFARLAAVPRSTSGLFEFLAPALPDLPRLPAHLEAATQPELGHQVVVESSEPEVARTLYTLAVLGQARRVVEVGVFRGYTSQHLAAALGPGGDLHLVDLSASVLDEAAGRAAAATTARVHRHLGRSTDPAVLAGVPGGCDLVFLDADHTERGVLAELDAWWPKVRVGGILAVHDTINVPGVGRAVHARADRGPTLTLATSRGSGLTLLRKT